ncbi:hypothetical protein T4E_2937 [Trichinella pseudospiralis]|uniref:Uncharacterized protein n=1 Tax=Trichinella pseudospiralis TaxID=6337 RepID=A0A0V0XRR6_TRIPS|nr:hypothetical protein T4E_2937 [Trichinella pseudospiralis]
MLTRCFALFACIDRKQKEVCHFQGGQKEALAFVGYQEFIIGKYGCSSSDKELRMFLTRKEKDIKTGLNWGRK